MIAAMLGFKPALDGRLSIATRSGIAAKVVSNPATMPTISERRILGTSKLCVSCGTRLSHPETRIRLRRQITSVNHFDRCIFQPTNYSLLVADELLLIRLMTAYYVLFPLLPPTILSTLTVSLASGFCAEYRLYRRHRVKGRHLTKQSHPRVAQRPPTIC